MATDPSKHPVLLTLALDDDSFAFFQALRQAHFPPERNFLNAHLTLFHKLPQSGLDEIVAFLQGVSNETAEFEMNVTGLWNLGGGVAYTLRSKRLLSLRAHMAAHWKDWLINQDRAFKPHVTVQNKVSNEAALALHAELSSSFAPFIVSAKGLELWRYDGGPWTRLARFEFQKASSA